ncbi:MAG: histidine kinase [Rhodoglobus sp.]
MAARATELRSLPPAKQPRNPISRKQVELVISRSVAVFGIVFGAQTVPWLLGQLDEAQPLYLWVMVPAIFGSLVFALVASIINRWVRPAHGLVSICFMVGLIAWPFAIISTDNVFPGIYWLYYLLTVATATGAIAFSTPVAVVYLFLAPVIYGIVRVTPFGGAAPWQLATLETVYSVILGAAVVIIVTMLRQAAANVDAAQATALDRYSHAVRQHATEVERVQVDSIVHDSVLTTLLSAARAYTPEAEALSATMAGNAIGHLEAAARVSPDDGTTVRLSLLSQRIQDAAAGMSMPFEVRVSGVGTRSIPVQAAEAINSAAVQAMVNSVQHGGGAGTARWVEIRGVRPGGIEVIVGDLGGGFSLELVPLERLGVRVSIIERLANAGGMADIDSAPGEGTIISIRWPDPGHADTAAQLALELGGGA